MHVCIVYLHAFESKKLKVKDVLLIITFLGIDFQTISKTRIVQVKIFYLFIICYMVCHINLAQSKKKIKN